MIYSGIRIERIGRGLAVTQVNRSRASAMVIGRCSASERVAASATQLVSSASSIAHGDVNLPATTSVNAASSARNASARRSMKNWYGSPPGNVTPGSAERSGRLSTALRSSGRVVVRAGEGGLVLGLQLVAG